MEFTYITTESQIEDLTNSLKDAKYLFLDTEVAVKNPKKIDFFNDKVRLIQIGTDEDNFVIDCFKVEKNKIKEVLKIVLETKGIVGHNLKFDIKFLKTNFDIFPQIVFDTMIASQILSEGKDIKHSLLAVSKREADINLDKSYQTSAWNIENLSKEQLTYAVKDIEVLKSIFPSLKEKLNKVDTPHKSSGVSKEVFGLTNPVAAIEFAFVPYLALIELRGMPVAKEELENTLKELSSTYQRMHIEFYRKYAVDPFSPQKVTNWIVSKLGINLPKTEKGSFTSQDKVLKKFIHIPQIKELLEIRHTKKLLDKAKELKQYAVEDKSFPEIYRVHSEYRQIGAPTGRMSSSQPNLQNIPPALRKLFQTPEGYTFIIADFSQIELRIAAEYTKDEVMINAFKEKKDMHRFTASLITGKPYEEITKEERQMAKAINFGLIYGISPKSLMEYANANYGVKISLSEAKEFHQRFFQHYEGFKNWHERVKNSLKQKREITVSSILGRKMKVSRFTDAVNYPIQATGSELLKMAVNFFYKHKKDLDAYVVNLVHDEIIVETNLNEAEEAVKVLEESLKSAGRIILKEVPVEYEVSISKTWEK